MLKKRKNTILKKREAKMAKKQAILNELNSNIEYLNKVKATVEKRRDTISKKQFIKDLMNAGESYNEEKQKKYEVNSTEKLRDRKKYEKKIEEALGSFKVVSFYDNLYYKVIKDDEVIKDAKKLGIPVPNYPVIKSLIENELRKQIEQNNSKNKLSGFITRCSSI